MMRYPHCVDCVALSKRRLPNYGVVALEPSMKHGTLTTKLACKGWFGSLFVVEHEHTSLLYGGGRWVTWCDACDWGTMDIGVMPRTELSP